MSRYRKTGAEYSIAFRVDHALGVFAMVWNHTEYDDPDPENLVVDEDKFSRIVTYSRIKELASKYNIPLTEVEIMDVLKGGI